MKHRLLRALVYWLALFAAAFCIFRGVTACAHRPPCMSGFDVYAEAGEYDKGERYTGGGITIYFDTTGACTAEEIEE